MAKSIKRKVAKKSPKRKMAKKSPKRKMAKVAKKSPKRKMAKVAKKSPKRVVKANRKYPVCLMFRLHRYDETEKNETLNNINALSARTKAFIKKEIKSQCANGFSSFEPIKNVSLSFNSDHILVKGTLDTDPNSEEWTRAYKYDIANWLDTIQHSNLLNDGVAGDGYVYYVRDIKVC